MSPTDAVDFSVIKSLRELAGDDDPGFVPDMIGLFLGDTPSRLEEMRHALDTDDAEALERAAHSLKSSSANLGANRFSEMCRRLEESGRTGSWDGVADGVAAVHDEYVLVESTLKSLA